VNEVPQYKTIQKSVQWEPWYPIQADWLSKENVEKLIVVYRALKGI